MLHYLGSYYIFNYTVSCYTILCYVMLNYVLLYHTILYSHLFKLSKVASSIILPAQAEPIWTLSEPVIKTLCLQMGGCPNPLAFFPAVQAWIQEHHTMNKTCTKHRIVLELKTHHIGSLFPIGEGCHRFFMLCNIASGILLPAKTEPI